MIRLTTAARVETEPLQAQTEQFEHSLTLDEIDLGAGAAQADEQDAPLGRDLQTQADPDQQRRDD
jgi:hypothetical protein